LVQGQAAQLAARSILAPTDLSETGDAGVACAFALAGAGATVHLLHVIDRPGTPNPLYAHYAPGRAPTAEERARQAAELRDRLDALVPPDARRLGVRVELHVDEAPEAAEAICEAADRVGADLVVLGSHGRTAIRRALLGSVTEEVLRGTRRAVVVIRSGHD
jgi:nucleotide-binding universal stress UspA family protein